MDTLQQGELQTILGGPTHHGIAQGISADRHSSLGRNDIIKAIAKKLKDAGADINIAAITQRLNQSATEAKLWHEANNTRYIRHPVVTENDDKRKRKALNLDLYGLTGKDGVPLVLGNTYKLKRTNQVVRLTGYMNSKNIGTGYSSTLQVELVGGVGFHNKPMTIDASYENFFGFETMDTVTRPAHADAPVIDQGARSPSQASSVPLSIHHDANPQLDVTYQGRPARFPLPPNPAFRSPTPTARTPSPETQHL